jgi:DNA-binding MarR family transcriptional regulator
VGTLTTTSGLPSQLRLAIMRLGRCLRQQAVGDITVSQLSALSTVARCGPLSLGELADIERIAPPSTTRIVGRLEERGLVVRTVDATDRRVARLAVSEAGQSVLNQTRTRRDAYLALRLQAMTAEERETLMQALPLLERLTGDEE